MVHAETLWSCTTCRACVEECPMMIEHVDADRRSCAASKRSSSERRPAKGALRLADLRDTDNPGGRPSGHAIDWAADLNLPLMPEERGRTCCSGSATARLTCGTSAPCAHRSKCYACQVDFAVLGNEECDRATLLAVSATKPTFQRLAGATSRPSAEVPLSPHRHRDPHVLHVLKNEYRAFDGNYEWCITAPSGGHDRTERAAPGPDTTAGDLSRSLLPRPLQRRIEAPRAVLARLGIDRVEMQRSGIARAAAAVAAARRSPIFRQAPDPRHAHGRRPRDRRRLVAVGCPQCTAMLEGVVEPRPEVVDIAELLLAGVERAMSAMTKGERRDPRAERLERLAKEEPPSAAATSDRLRRDPCRNLGSAYATAEKPPDRCR